MYSEVSGKDDLELDLSTNSKLSGLTSNLSVSKKTMSLSEYIDKRKIKFGDKTQSITHQWWDNITNVNFAVKDEEYDEFLEIYARELKKEKKIFHLMEKPREIGPLCLDFDLKQTSPERTLCDDNITQVISIVNNVIANFFALKDKQSLTSFVFMKEEPFFRTDKMLYSDGFHLQYPNLILNVHDRFLIYNESRKQIIKEELFSNVYSVLASIDKKSNNKDESDTETDSDDNENECKLSDVKKEEIYDDIFDMSVIHKNCWFMYGSGKLLNNEPNLYHLKYMFDYNVDEIEDRPRTKELVKILSIRKPFSKEDIINPKQTEEYNKLVSEAKAKYMKNTKNFDSSKLFNSVNPASSGNLGNSSNPNLQQIKNTTDNKLTKLTSSYNKGENIQDHITLARKLVKLLSPKRAVSYNDWIPVGWALYNVSPTLLPEFLEFSKLHKKKYDEEYCKKVWDDCSKRHDDSGYSIPSLVRWAKEDNEDGYKKILREKLNTLLTNGNINTDFDVATMIYEMYKHEYACSSTTKKVWWEFKDHRWNRIDGSSSISVRLSTEVSLEFVNLQRDMQILAIQEVGQNADRLQKTCKDIQTLIFNLKKGAFKGRVIDECANLFHIKEFEQKLDQNNYLVGFTNGVYDLKNRIFRDGSPDDMIGKSVGYSYINFSRDDDIIKDVEKFIENIQPEKDMRDYLMTYCASFLEGSNKDQKFMIWTGCGSNGKGTLIDLLDNAFNGKTDGYFGSLPPTILTQKRGSSSAATPELADKFGKRVITLQEPEGDDKINVGFMKNITGQDKIEARPLYGDPFQYTPQFKLLLACNHLPNIPSDDGGTWRRIRVIDFFIKFTSNPQNKNERKSDSKLREKIKGWNKAFMWLLINVYYPMYVNNDGLESLEPERVKIATDKYKADSNAIMEFFNDQLEKSSNENMALIDVYEMFKQWYTNSYNDKKPIPRKKIIEYFEQNGFEYNKNTGYIKGIRQKEASSADISDLDANL